VVPSLAAHPLARLHRAGVSVTLSTDDRTVTGIGLSEEYARVRAALGLEPAELAAIALNGFRRAFADAAALRGLLAEARAAWSAWAGVTIS
jgi:adenosine deaminase